MVLPKPSSTDGIPPFMEDLEMIKHYQVQGIDIAIDTSDENVFQPHPITLMLSEALEINRTDTVLEIGSGSGLVAIAAAKLGAKHVYASDLARRANSATRRNANLNGINGQMTVVHGDSFTPFEEQVFEVIVANPPCMPFPPQAMYCNQGLSLAVNGGHDGADLSERLRDI